MIRSAEFGQSLLSATRTKLFRARRRRSDGKYSSLTSSEENDIRGVKIIVDADADDDCTATCNDSSSISDASESFNDKTPSSIKSFSTDVGTDKILEEQNDMFLDQEEKEEDRDFDFLIPVEDTESRIRVSSLDATKRDCLMDDGRLFEYMLGLERRRLEESREEIEDGYFQEMESSDIEEEEENEYLLNVW